VALLLLVLVNDHVTATLSPLALAQHLKTRLFDWDRQRVGGLFRTRSTNLRIIIIIIIMLAQKVLQCPPSTVSTPNF